MKVAAIQMVSGMDAARNLQNALDFIALSADQDCELLVLPEYFCLLGARDTDKLSIAEDEGQGPLQDALREAARRLQVWIVAGTLPLKTHQADRVFNACLAFNPQGQQVARYDKMHLFAFDNGTEHYDEARVLQAGRSPVAFDLPSRDGATWRVGLSVCYDLRFPELYRTLQADLILIPSAFTHTTGQAHWETLIRARAIENQACVVAPAQGGQHENGRRTWGHSMVVDSWGAVLGSRDVGAGLVIAELDHAAMQQRRAQLPALHHRLL
ncbi:carbon-nitrogen hydrolase family protein [Variovorax sp. PCZ-1]|uniref:carbon-nitrogen hydrolase family protein n=1 Tax=Variovorax sp. PCZ-1 TaxID=2835533 RepID=UPI001BD1027F|nr:carbon-nitrogen hydrolase family protein [Variovorax sp. PCZ-1]MBS7808899.1 carbon-nitrogen hydrolase family protein [Variovorax sp. PCZ-1]